MVTPLITVSTFDGQVVLVTGASSGIGAAVAREFARHGAHTILVARTISEIEQLSRELTFGTVRSVAMHGDVTRDGDLEHVVQHAQSQFGKIDVVVASAGFAVKGAFAELSVEDYRRQMETNVFGVLRTLYATLPELRRSRGRIVLIGSMFGMVPAPRGTAYSMSKHALTALADGLSHELVQDGVSVTHILAGFVETAIFNTSNEGVRGETAERRPPMWLTLSAERAAQRIVAAAYRRKRTRIVSGHARAAILLQRYLPGLISVIASMAARRGTKRLARPSL